MSLNLENFIPKNGSNHSLLAASDVDEKHKPFEWVVKEFQECLSADSETAAAVAAVRALTQVIKVSKANTMMQLEQELKLAADLLQKCGVALSVSSGCELFTRFVTRTSLDVPDFVQCKEQLIERGEQYTKQASKSRDKISQLGATFIRSGSIVFTHGYSRVVIAILLRAATEGTQFRVVVSEGRPDYSGYITASTLQAANIPVTVIVDSAVGSYMEHVDLVLLGAEGIVENGGAVNKIGSYQFSIVAKAFNKPIYIAAESFKFMRFYPLSQKDLRTLIAVNRGASSRPSSRICSSCLPSQVDSAHLKLEDLTHDYTPPSYITLLFTELGVLTPAAVSDELIKLYY